MSELVPATNSLRVLDHETIKLRADASMRQIDNFVTWKANVFRWRGLFEEKTIAGEQWIVVSGSISQTTTPPNRGTHPKQAIIVCLPPDSTNVRGVEVLRGKTNLKILIRMHANIEALLYTCMHLVQNPSIKEADVSLIYVDVHPMYIPHVNSILSTRFAGRFTYGASFNMKGPVGPALVKSDVSAHKSVPVLAVHAGANGQSVLRIIGKGLMSTVITGIPETKYDAWVLQGLPPAVLMYYVTHLPAEVRNLTIEGHITPGLLFSLFNRDWTKLKIQFTNPINEQHVAAVQCAVDRGVGSVRSLMLQDMVFSENNARFILRPVLQLKRLEQLVIKTGADFLSMNRPDQRAEWLGNYLLEIARRGVQLVYDWPTGIVLLENDFKVLLSTSRSPDSERNATYAIRPFDHVQFDKPHTGLESRRISREYLIPPAKLAWGQQSGTSSEFDYDAVYDSFP